MYCLDVEGGRCVGEFETSDRCGGGAGVELFVWVVEAGECWVDWSKGDVV